MPITSIVRVSFQTGPAYMVAHGAVRMALVGHKTAHTGPKPFAWVGTHLYQVRKGNDLEVSDALVGLAKALRKHRKILDFASVTMFRTKGLPKPTLDPAPAPRPTRTQLLALKKIFRRPPPAR